MESRNLNSLKPRIPTNATPTEIIGGHNYAVWVEIAKWWIANRNLKKYHGEPEKLTKDYEATFNHVDRAFYSRKLDELAGHGFHFSFDRDANEYKWFTRRVNPIEEMYDDNQTRGGVPPLSELEKMPLEEVKRLGREAFKAIG